MRRFTERDETARGNSGSNIPVMKLRRLVPRRVGFSKCSMSARGAFAGAFGGKRVLFNQEETCLGGTTVTSFSNVYSKSVAIVRTVPNGMSPLLLPFVVRGSGFFSCTISHSTKNLSPEMG